MSDSLSEHILFLGLAVLSDPSHGISAVFPHPPILPVAENSLANEVYISDEEDYSTSGTQPAVAGAAAASPASSSHSTASSTAAYSHHGTQPHSSKPVDVKMDPSNPEGLTALWVGNVLPEVTDKKLRKMFSEWVLAMCQCVLSCKLASVSLIREEIGCMGKVVETGCFRYGQVTSVRLLPEKYCAFINFKTKESAGRAMNGLQVGTSTKLWHKSCYGDSVDNNLSCGGRVWSVLARDYLSNFLTTPSAMAVAAAAWCCAKDQLLPPPTVKGKCVRCGMLFIIRHRTRLQVSAVAVVELILEDTVWW